MDEFQLRSTVDIVGNPIWELWRKREPPALFGPPDWEYVASNPEKAILVSAVEHLRNAECLTL